MTVYINFRPRSLDLNEVARLHEMYNRERLPELERVAEQFRRRLEGRQA